MGGDVASPATLGQARSAGRSILSPLSSGTAAREGTEQTKVPPLLLSPNPIHVNYALVIDPPSINY